MIFFNRKKKKLQSPHAGERHTQPCVPASRRCSPPLPLRAHQTKQMVLMLMLLGQSGSLIPLPLPPLPNTITQPPLWVKLRSDHRPKPPLTRHPPAPPLPQSPPSAPPTTTTVTSVLHLSSFTTTRLRKAARLSHQRSHSAEAHCSTGDRWCCCVMLRGLDSEMRPLLPHYFTLSITSSSPFGAYNQHTVFPCFSRWQSMYSNFSSASQEPPITHVNAHKIPSYICSCIYF